MIAVAEKYALEMSMPMPITSDRQHRDYLSVLDKLARKPELSRDEDNYAQVLLTLIEAYEQENHKIPDASPVDVRRTL
jgi:antitoxin component HigA of HigAB toxin-antitoxin module